ncbi:MAG: RICIN domain-containing protein [Bacteroidales bacterium]|nr:RICIN domain-containing protein [Bacteroidales bacterium]
MTIQNRFFIIALFSLPLSWVAGGGLFAQERPAHTSMYLQAPVYSATPLVFSSSTDISQTSLIPAEPVKWGMDVAWNSADNVVRGTNFIGTDVMQIGRISFQPSDLVDANGNLSSAQQTALRSRLTNITKSGARVFIMNCDHEALNSANYYGKPEEWYKVIKASVQYVQKQGYTVCTVSPFNEPDYTSWGEGTKEHFKEICRLIREDSFFDNIRISAGNTLNCDQALSWYNYMKPYVSEGNTHQLAGSFATYADFWKTVRKDGNVATADELHNTMEALVGIHYGMQNGIWWGYDAACRGEFCKASYYGKEIGYAENRTAWSGAAVYKRPSGRIDAFMGVSERQASTNTFEFWGTDRELYYDSYGPVQNYAQELPGGSGYATDDQRNAERMIQIHYGEDVPVEYLAPGTYVLQNKRNNSVLSYDDGATGSAVQLAMETYTGTKSNTYQQWIVEPVSDRIGGDFGYFVLRSARNEKQVIDLKDWSTSAGGTLIGFAGDLGNNEQWFVEYAGEGYWYLRSRHSGLYVETAGVSTTARVQQNVFTDNDRQKWRFMPVDAAIDKTAPAAPSGLSAQPQGASVRLTWNENSESDVTGYEVLRGVADETAAAIQWDVIGRMINANVFVDNGIRNHNASYFYKVKAVDKSRNRSIASDSVQVTLSQNRNLVACYSFDNTFEDASENLFDAASSGVTFNTVAVLKKEGTHSLVFDGTDDYLLLPASVGSLKQMTLAVWANHSNRTTAWTRLFDFGNDTNQYFFVTLNSGSDARLVLKNGGNEQILSVATPTAGWHHIAVTLGEQEVAFYVDGKLVGSSTDITLRPSDIKPVRNYIGRSQYAADPLFKGYVDDLRIYDFALTAEEVAALYAGQEVSAIGKVTNSISSENTYYDLTGRRLNHPAKGLTICNGKLKLIQ